MSDLNTFIERYFHANLSDKQLAIQDIFNSPTVPHCPKLERSPVPLDDMIEILNTCLFEFGEIHCLHRCNFCGVSNGFSSEVSALDEIEDIDEQFQAVRNCYDRRFTDLHIAFSLLPDKHYQALLAITNGACPACAIAIALQQFPVIAHFSGINAPGKSSDRIVRFPCRTMGGFIEGNKIAVHIQDINALTYIENKDIPAMPPFERTKLRQALEIGRDVCKYLLVLYDHDALPGDEDDGHVIHLMDESECVLLGESSSLGGFMTALSEKGRYVNKKKYPIQESDEPDSKKKEQGIKADAVAPPIGGWTTRNKVADIVNRKTDALRRWEKDGVAPGDVIWPKGDLQGNTCFYRVEEVWPSIMKMLPGITLDRQKEILNEIMELRSAKEEY